MNTSPFSSDLSPFNSDLSLIRYPFSEIVPSKKKQRTDKWDPKPLSEKPAHQEALNCLSIREPIRVKLCEMTGQAWHDSKVIQVSAKKFVELSSTLNEIESYQELIQHHVALRVALFFQQAIVCYNTPFHFEIAETEGQIFTAPTLKIASGKNTKQTAFQAAHSSTIPSLKACLRNEHEVFQHDASKPPRYFSFLKASHLENLDNSTVALPADVNRIDTLIDGKANKAGLRQPTIDLINQLAQKKIDPIEATRQFINHFSTQLTERPRASKSWNASKQKVIEIYQEQLAEIHSLASVPIDTQGHHPFFDSLINVNVGLEKAQDAAHIRQIVYQRKFEIIRESMLTESRVQESINEVLAPQLNPETKHLAKLAILYSVRTDNNLRKTLEKLFCISVEAIQRDRVLCANLSLIYFNGKVAIDNSLRDIRLILRNFRKLENSFQAMLLREFRTTLRHLKQKQLAHLIQTEIHNQIDQELVKENPNFVEIQTLSKLPSSAATISRLENSRIHIIADFKTPEAQRRKVLTLQQAQIIAKVLNVQVGHFFCSFFASES